MSEQIEIIESSDTEGQVQVRVREALTIHVAREVHSALEGAFAKGNTVVLDLEEVEQIDLTGLQLVCAAHRSSIKLGKTLLVTGQDREEIAGVAMAAGFVRDSACTKGADLCFWSGGTR